eukprot:6176597-Pleurochrysis_carterae.AAC.2
MTERRNVASPMVGKHLLVPSHPLAPHCLTVCFSLTAAAHAHPPCTLASARVTQAPLPPVAPPPPSSHA